jgi:hypothetical protein
VIFCLFSAKKLAFFLKTIVMMQFLQKNSNSLNKKCQFFGENISNIIQYKIQKLGRIKEIFCSKKQPSLYV